MVLQQNTEGRLPVTEGCPAIRRTTDPIIQMKSEIETLLTLGGYTRGREVCEELLKMTPNDPEIYLAYGFFLKELGQYEKAIEAFDKILQLNKRKIVEAYSYKASLLYDMRRFDHAYTTVKEAIRYFPTHRELISLHNEMVENRARNASIITYLAQGMHLMEGESYKEALAAFTQVIQLDELYALPHYNNGVIFSRLGDFEKALAAFDRAIELNEYYADAYFGKGGMHIKLEQYHQAIKAFDQAITLDEANMKLHIWKANTLMFLGQLDKALETVQNALRINPEYEIALNTRTKLLGEIRKLKGHK